MPVCFLDFFVWSNIYRDIAVPSISKKSGGVFRRPQFFLPNFISNSPLDDSPTASQRDVKNALEWFPDKTETDENTEIIQENKPRIFLNVESIIESIVPKEGETSSIFLNATAGLFFPSCHVHLVK
jgi:hypothetical protein